MLSSYCYSLLHCPIINMQYCLYTIKKEARDDSNNTCCIHQLSFALIAAYKVYSGQHAVPPWQLVATNCCLHIVYKCDDLWVACMRQAAVYTMPVTDSGLAAPALWTYSLSSRACSFLSCLALKYRTARGSPRSNFCAKSSGLKLVLDSGASTCKHAVMHHHGISHGHA